MKEDYKELKRNITIAGITQKEFAELIRVKYLSITNLKQEDRKVPNSIMIISVLMREMARAEVDFTKALKELDLSYKKAPKRKKEQ